MPTLDWLNRATAFTTAARVPYRLLEQVSLHTRTAQAAPAHVAPVPAQAELLSSSTEDAAERPSITDNLLIQGDNLEALKALLPFYRGQVKCIFIDPPYNTKSAFEHYDDNLEHAQWLSMMLPRLQLLRELLREDGSIWVTIDDNESHYLKVLMDEVFGRKNFINQISIKAKNTAGASGGGEDKKLKKNVETVFVYVKNNDSSFGFQRFNDVYEEVDLFELIDEMEDEGKSWKYTSVLTSYGQEIDRRVILDGSGEEILVKKVRGVERTTIRRLTTPEKPEAQVYLENFDKIFSDTNAQTSIRSRIIDEFESLTDDEMLIASYVPRSGRDKGKIVEHFYISPTIRRVIWLKDTAVKKKNSIIKKDKLGTLWTMFNWNNVTKEGDIQFPNGKKPEALLRTILDLATKERDLVLDSFLGSGTAAAVAHKMGRRWIGIEMGEHAATHCLPRLQKVIDGEQGGISQAVNWTGGGGFRFMRLGDTVFDEHGRIHPAVRFATLAAFVWQQETGHAFDPAAAQAGTPYLGTHYVFDSCLRTEDEGSEPIPPIKKPQFACYLLFNGILGDKRPASGNVLTQAVLDALLALHATTPEPDAPLLVYGEACRLGEERLKQANVTFRHIPYDVKAR